MDILRLEWVEKARVKPIGFQPVTLGTWNFK